MLELGEKTRLAGLQSQTRHEQGASGLAGTYALSELGRAEKAFGRKDFVGKLVVTVDE